MSTWKTCKLGEVAEYVNARCAADSLTAENYISTENLLPNRGGHVMADTLPQFGNVVAWQEGDVLVSNIRPYFKKIWRGMGSGGASADVMVFRVKDKEGMFPLFFYYRLASDDFFAHVMAGATGAKMPRGNRKHTIQFEFSLPPLAEQERIAGVLGAYDDLIAVNERRMALLEEAAHRLWRDRFVTHADPAWPLRPLGEVAEFRKGKTITGTQARSGAIPVVAGGTEPAYYHDSANTKAPVLTVSASGTAGFTRLYYEDVWASDCSYLDGAMGVPLFFVYCFLKANRGMVENLKRGAAQPHVYTSDLNALEGRFDMDAAQAFEAQVVPYFEAVGVLSRENALLREGRDGLLPRLLREEA